MVGKITVDSDVMRRGPLAPDFADDDVIRCMVYEANLTMITLSITLLSSTLSSDARFEISAVSR